TTFLQRVDELTKIKSLAKTEREQFLTLITEQSEQYEQEKIQREQKFNQQIDNLRKFQLIADIPARFKRTHKTNLSTSSLPTSHNNSPRNSYIIEDDRIIFSSQPNNFKNELNRKGYQEKGGII